MVGDTDRISIHTPLAGSDPMPDVRIVEGAYFNPHSPCGERRGVFEHEHELDIISIHTPLAGSDLAVSKDVLKALVFQSTLPLRGAT
mgnify:CR=1 FL=1